MRAAGVSRWLVAQNATPQRFMYIFGTIPMPTFYDRFVECAERWPQNVALEIQRRDGTESYTYSEARRMAESVGRWLAENGAQPGARVAILADNHPRWVTTYLGIIAAGCPAVPLDTAFHADQIAKLPKDAVLGVLPLFHVLSQMANLLLPLVKGARVVHLETLNTTELLRALQEREITAFAVVPQFFYLIHERIFKEVSQRGKVAQVMLRVLMNVNRALRAIGINAVRPLFGKLHATFGQRMRYLITGGSRFDPQIARDFYALGIDVLQAYGLTETTGAAFANKPTNNVIGSVGPPLPGVEAKIVEPQPQEEGPAVGESAIHGAIVMKGYWNREEAK